jgi:hypothetical protein
MRLICCSKAQHVSVFPAPVGPVSKIIIFIL